MSGRITKSRARMAIRPRTPSSSMRSKVPWLSPKKSQIGELASPLSRSAKGMLTISSTSPRSWSKPIAERARAASWSSSSWGRGV